jgi:hypothetical protein
VRRYPSTLFLLIVALLGGVSPAIGGASKSCRDLLLPKTSKGSVRTEIPPELKRDFDQALDEINEQWKDDLDPSVNQRIKYSDEHIRHLVLPVVSVSKK